MLIRKMCIAMLSNYSNKIQNTDFATIIILDMYNGSNLDRVKTNSKHISNLKFQFLIPHRIRINGYHSI